jgi:hypothetical protein
MKKLKNIKFDLKLLAFEKRFIAIRFVKKSNDGHFFFPPLAALALTVFLTGFLAAVFLGALALGAAFLATFLAAFFGAAAISLKKYD